MIRITKAVKRETASKVDQSNAEESETGIKTRKVNRSREAGGSNKKDWRLGVDPAGNGSNQTKSVSGFSE